MEHLLNCHGEWAAILGIVVPLLTWFRLRLPRRVHRHGSKQTAP